MCKEKRIEYLVCTMCVLITGFIVYGLIGLVGQPIDNSRLQSFLLFGCLGGFGFSMIMSGIILSVRFISKRSLIFKIIASLLWFITFGCAVYAGVFTYFPYQIYNIVKIIKDSDNKDRLNT